MKDSCRAESAVSVFCSRAYVMLGKAGRASLIPSCVRSVSGRSQWRQEGDCCRGFWGLVSIVLASELVEYIEYIGAAHFFALNATRGRFRSKAIQYPFIRKRNVRKAWTAASGMM